MENIIQFQEALGSLIDISPEPKKVTKRVHEFKLSYDTNHSSVSSAWFDCSSLISKSFNFLVETESKNMTVDSISDHLNLYENNVELNDILSLEEIHVLINDEDDLHLSNLQGLELLLGVDK